MRCITTLILATGSYPWIPPIAGAEGSDCFVYRTIEDLNAIEACARRSKRGAVIGGGLLGLEAAGALKNLGIETHVIEFAPVLMAEQLDTQGGEQLRRKIEQMGVQVHTGKIPGRLCITLKAVKRWRSPMAARSTSTLSCSPPAFARRISWRNSAAALGQRGGVAINDRCQTSDAAIYAIGECAAGRIGFTVWWRRATNGAGRQRCAGRA